MKLRSLVIVLLLSACLSVSAQLKPYVQPDFTATTMDGQKVTLSDLRGKVVVLNLWFINCPNCLAEIGELNRLVGEYKGNKEVVFLAPASSPKAELVKFLKKNPFSYEIFPDAGNLIISKFATPDKNGNLGLPFPMHYVLDREGMVRVRVQGTKGIAAVREELKKQFTTKSD